MGGLWSEKRIVSRACVQIEIMCEFRPLFIWPLANDDSKEPSQVCMGAGLSCYTAALPFQIILHEPYGHGDGACCGPWMDWKAE
jgi:hypothetical protein